MRVVRRGIDRSARSTRMMSKWCLSGLPAGGLIGHISGAALVCPVDFDLE